MTEETAKAYRDKVIRMATDKKTGDEGELISAAWLGLLGSMSSAELRSHQDHEVLRFTAVHFCIAMRMLEEAGGRIVFVDPPESEETR